jgi:uncharacterized OB-fold protein
MGTIGWNQKEIIKSRNKISLTSMTKCPVCETESKPGTLLCPSCGSDLSGVPPIYDDPNSNAKAMSMLFYGLAGMMVFFAFGFMLPGLLAESAFLIVSFALVLVALIFVIIGRSITRKERRRFEHLRKEWVVHGKCEYCGTQNPPGNQRCGSCGAPLENQVR